MLASEQPSFANPEEFHVQYSTTGINLDWPEFTKKRSSPTSRDNTFVDPPQSRPNQFNDMALASIVKFISFPVMAFRDPRARFVAIILEGIALMKVFTWTTEKFGSIAQLFILLGICSVVVQVIRSQQSVKNLNQIHVY